MPLQQTLEQLLLARLDAHSAVVVALAFAAGVVSSLLPCTLAMLPVLVGYVGGYAEDSKWSVLRQVLMFMLGVALVMTILGVSASMVGVAFGTWVGKGWYLAIGVLAMLIACNLMGWVHLPLPKGLSKLPQQGAGKWVSPLLLGMAFGITSSPCGTPFLAAILGFISRERNIWLGGASLFSYALGQGMLFLVVGLFTGLLKHMAILRHVGRVLTVMSALSFFVFGLMLLAVGFGIWPRLLTALHLLG